MKPEIMAAIIGIVGSLTGAVVGWLLNVYARNSGKIYIDITKSGKEIGKDKYGEYYAIGYGYLQIYNKKDIPYGINNCSMLLKKGDDIVNLENKCRYTNTNIMWPENEWKNIRPREYVEVFVRRSYSLGSEEENEKYKDYEMWMSYKENGKKKEHKLLISK